MTRTLLHTRGRPTEDAVAGFREAGFTDAQVLELVLAIAVKSISNWSNHLFATEVDDAFAHRAWSAPGPT